ERGRDVLDTDADAPAPNLAELKQLPYDALNHIARYREADADVAARRRENRGVDALQRAVEAYQRTPRIAGVDRRVRLDEVLVAFDVDAAAAERADDSGRRRLSDPERITDREHEVADVEIVGVAERNFAQIVRFDPQQGDVRRGIAAYDLGVELPAVRERHDDVVGVLHHVAIRDDQPSVGVDDDPGADALLRQGLLELEVVGELEESAKERVFEQRIALGRRSRGHHGHVDDGRANALEQRRERRIVVLVDERPSRRDRIGDHGGGGDDDTRAHGPAGSLHACSQFACGKVEFSARSKMYAIRICTDDGGGAAILSRGAPNICNAGLQF